MICISWTEKGVELSKAGLLLEETEANFSNPVLIAFSFILGNCFGLMNCHKTYMLSNNKE